MAYVNYIKLLNEVANVYGAYSKTFITLSEIIDKCVSADVVEVKHGEWVDKFNNKYYNQVYVCSECGEKAYIKFVLNELGNTTYTQALTPFCPTCGADMRGGKNDL